MPKEPAVVAAGTRLVPLEILPTDTTAQVADLAFAGRYVPAGEGPDPVAGDFYDVLQLGPDLVALLVGDVSGHGPGALARMQELRAAARAYAIEEPGPASVLARLDRFLERVDSEALATLWYGEYAPSTGSLVYASAGHPPPVVHSYGQPTRLLNLATAPPLGTGLAHALALEHCEVLPPGAVLIAYSDGLVERHDADLDDQLDRLHGLVRGACDPARSGTAAQIASQILESMVPEPEKAQDDVCLLVVRRAPSASLVLKRDGSDVAKARRHVARELVDAGLDQLVEDAVLAVSELTTNALIHTDSEIRVSVAVAEDPFVVRVAVEDGSPSIPVPGTFDDTSMCGRGLLLVMQITARWGVEQVDGAGKRVWFEMEREPVTQDDLTADELLRAWGLDQEGIQPQAPGASRVERHVQVPGVRCDLLFGAKSHLDDLVRECVLVAEGASTAVAVRDELSALAQRLTDLSVRLVSFRNQVRRQALTAATRGRQVMTLELWLEDSLRSPLMEYRDLLDEVDVLCDRGVLLTSTDSVEHRVFRRWKLDRVIEQLED